MGAAAVLAMGWAGSAAAQDPAPAAAPQQQQAGPARPPVDQTVRQVQETINAVLLTQAQGALRMSDDQFAAFFPKMHKLQMLRLSNQTARRQRIQELNRLTQPGAATPEATIGEKLKASDDLDARAESDERAAQADVDSILTTFQRARLRVLEENMERRTVQLISQLLAQGGRGTPDPQSQQPPAAPAGRVGRGGGLHKH